MLGILAVAVLMLSGCGKGIDTPPAVPSEFTPYVERFIRAATERGDDASIALQLEVSLGDLATNGGEVGECHHSFSAKRRIIMDRAYWAVASEAMREVAIFHELGHCVLHRVHNNEQDESGCPLSLMSGSLDPCVWDRYETQEGKAPYLNELFRR